MSEYIAIKGGLLWDGSGADNVSESVVLVKEGEIFDVGNTQEVEIPKDAKIIDAKGKTVLPGLMDLHVHIFQMIGTLKS